VLIVVVALVARIPRITTGVFATLHINFILELVGIQLLVRTGS
jgi:hypothetical protein